MPKRLSLKDKKTIYYAYKIGEINGVSYYSDVYSLQCQFSSFIGNKSIFEYGVRLDYDAVAIIQYNEDTKFIDKFTKFWFGNMPVDGNSSSDFSIVKISDVHNGLFVVNLLSRVNNAHNIWYEFEDNIYTADVMFDKDNMTVTTPKNMYLPIWYNTKVWYREPEDATTTESAIHLVDINKAENYTKYKFEEGLYGDIDTTGNF